MKMAFWVKYSPFTTDLIVGFRQGEDAWTFWWSGFTGGNVGGGANSIVPFDVPGSLPALHGRYFYFELSGTGGGGGRVMSFRLYGQAGGPMLYEIDEKSVAVHGLTGGGVSCEGNITSGGNVTMRDRRGQLYYHRDRHGLAMKLGLITADVPRHRTLNNQDWELLRQQGYIGRPTDPGPSYGWDASGQPVRVR
jgi:hypothetical protein